MLKICVFTCVRIQQKHWMPLLRVVLLVVTCQVFHSQCSSLSQANAKCQDKRSTHSTHKHQVTEALQPGGISLISLRNLIIESKHLLRSHHFLQELLCCASLCKLSPIFQSQIQLYNCQYTIDCSHNHDISKFPLSFLSKSFTGTTNTIGWTWLFCRRSGPP